MPLVIYGLRSVHTHTHTHTHTFADESDYKKPAAGAHLVKNLGVYVCLLKAQLNKGLAGAYHTIQHSIHYYRRMRQYQGSNRVYLK